MSNHRILSIQSHVVSGYVGNKSAVFPLQLLGFDVDVVNSVHFSNHTGYENGFTGDVLTGDQLRSIMKGLEKNGLLSSIDHLLTGYIGSESFLEAVVHVIQTLRKYRKDLRYVCDPVLGDRGKFYVPESLVQVYIQKVIPLADVITPNQFEVEKLTGVQVRSLIDARTACEYLHRMGPNLVCITSVILSDINNDRDVEPDSKMSMIASQLVNAKVRIWRVDFPVLPGQFTGTGDLCAALFLAHTARLPVSEAIEKVANTMHAVMTRTHQSCGITVQSRELKIVQSKKDIEHPPKFFKATILEI